MAELVLGEKEDSDWFLSDSYFAIQTAKMDCSQTDIIDLCSWKDIQKETFLVLSRNLIVWPKILTERLQNWHNKNYVNFLSL